MIKLPKYTFSKNVCPFSPGEYLIIDPWYAIGTYPFWADLCKWCNHNTGILPYGFYTTIGEHNSFVWRPPQGDFCFSADDGDNVEDCEIVTGLLSFLPMSLIRKHCGGVDRYGNSPTTLGAILKLKKRSTPDCHGRLFICGNIIALTSNDDTE